MRYAQCFLQKSTDSCASRAQTAVKEVDRRTVCRYKIKMKQAMEDQALQMGIVVRADDARIKARPPRKAQVMSEARAKATAEGKVAECDKPLNQVIELLDDSD